MQQAGYWISNPSASVDEPTKMEKIPSQTNMIELYFCDTYLIIRSIRDFTQIVFPTTRIYLLLSPLVSDQTQLCAEPNCYSMLSSILTLHRHRYVRDRIVILWSLLYLHLDKTFSLAIRTFLFLSFRKRTKKNVFDSDYIKVSASDYSKFFFHTP